MKKLILLLSIISLFFQSTFAQTGGLNFQGIARNPSGAVLANQKINLKFSILKTTETGTIEYTEIKEATTNAQGIFAVVVGEVNATSFAAVDWKLSPKFLKVEMDAAGGTSFITMGTTRLQNVPFAYYANGVNANNIDGAVPVSKGGTGATNVASARANLGLAIGTNVQAPLVAGKDYLTPTGNAIGLTNFPILNQNTTGNAATATLAGNITATSNSSLTTLPNLTTVGTISSGVWSGTTIAISKGGTGASSASAAITNLGAESITNKSTDIFADASSLTKYPSVKAIKDYVDTRVITGVSTNTDLNITSVNGLQLGRGTGTNTSNIAVGASALSSNTTGIQNTASGYNALNSNTAGIQNTAIGYNALQNNTIGWHNTAIGHDALLNNTTGSHNTATGSRALLNNTTGSYNTVIGRESLFYNTTGLQNIAIGYRAGVSVTTGANNTFIGVNSNVSSGTVSNSTAIGNEAIITASNTIQLGNTSVTDVKTSGAITAAGYKTPTGTSTQFLMADGSVSSGVASVTSINGLELGRGAGSNPSNVAVGASALNNNTSGGGNTASGRFALQSNTAGSNNTAIGATALLNNTTGGYNTASGAGALGSNTIGSYNTATGIGALSSNTTGWHNTASGVNTLMFNTQGWYNTAIGNTALLNNTTGGYNTASGYNALYRNTTGGNNTAIGYEAGSSVTTGANNTFIGVNSNASSGTVSNSTAVGNGAVVTASNSIQLGNTAVTNVKTSGSLTTGAITYPNTDGLSGQVLTTTGTGTLTWTTPQQTYAVGINLSLGGYVIYVTPNGKHGLVVPLYDQTLNANSLPNYYSATNIISDPSNYDENAKNFTDWRIPTRFELNLMYSKRQEIGNFVNIYGQGGYWTSTEYDGNNQKYYLFFLDNNSNMPIYAQDSYLGNVRAIRPF